VTSKFSVLDVMVCVVVALWSPPYFPKTITDTPPVALLSISNQARLVAVVVAAPAIRAVPLEKLTE